MPSKTIGLPSLIFGILMILVAIVHVFVPVAGGFIDLAIPVIASIASTLGYANWRKKYLEVKKYYQSKTVWGAILVTLPVIFVALTAFFGWQIPDIVTQIVQIWILAAGGLNGIGIFSALKKAGVIGNG
jgi:uncharacterized membrane protein YidH (DUF202 family)